MTNRKAKKFTAFLWHRRIGLVALSLVVILAITGIMLNHTESFKLDETYVNNSSLLDWYGIEPEDEPVSYRVKNSQSSFIISLWQNHLFFDNDAIINLEQNIHGAIGAEQFIVIALDNEIILLSYEGELIERLSTNISFSNIQRLGMKYKRPVIETSEPLYYMADEHILDWDVIINEGIEWTEEYKLNENEYQQLLLAYRGNGLKLERVVLDLHSGRIFGIYGIYLMDAAAIALLWLSLSGLWVWSSRRQKMRKKKHYLKHHRN
ncbi:MAG: PepSY domain-containing protein [Gammaproteobacteria bacterium]|nr:PepSY domain-containing protein [Gammaproteobacteria bacterium]